MGVGSPKTPSHYQFPCRVGIYRFLMCFRNVRQNTDSQVFYYSYFSGLNDRTQCNLLMNWAEVNALVALTEMNTRP